MTNDDRSRLRYRIEKRVANTEYWGCVGYADTRAHARAAARTVEGGPSTGVRIVVIDPDPQGRWTGEDADIELIAGC